MSLCCSQSHGFSLGSCFLVLCLVSFQIHVASSALIMSLRNHHSKHHNRRPMLQANQTACSLFVGSWVRDDSYPFYFHSSSCPNVIEPQFDCQMFGRPDTNYLKYRWKPLNCELPRFNGVDFLEKMRGKNVMFVGDSIGKNQWESLLCMISSSVPGTSTQMSRGMPFSIFKFLDYGVSISFYKAPYLVDIDMAQGKKILRLEDISGNGNTWRNADVLFFNTGHWWSHKGSLQGWDYMESGGTYYQDMDRLVALEKALRTWAKWIDNNIDTSRTKVFFLSISPTHYNTDEGAAGASMATAKNCYGETAPMDVSPMNGADYPEAYPDQMRVLNDVLQDMHTPTFLMDITLLSELRKDAHPSIYSGDLSPQERANPYRSADCSHWCLPGLPDTWNELLYTALFF